MNPSFRYSFLNDDFIFLISDIHLSNVLAINSCILFVELDSTIYGLYVDEKHRNRGIASTLIKSCEEELKNWNVKYMKLYVHKNSIDTDFLIKFYKKLGYEIFESSYSDEYCMLKTIKK